MLIIFLLVQFSNATCPICLEEIESDLIVTMCPGNGHVFHKSCLMKCAHQRTSKIILICPMCRTDISMQMRIQTEPADLSHVLKALYCSDSPKMTLIRIVSLIEGFCAAISFLCQLHVAFFMHQFAFNALECIICFFRLQHRESFSVNTLLEIFSWAVHFSTFIIILVTMSSLFFLKKWDLNKIECKGGGCFWIVMQHLFFWLDIAYATLRMHSIKWKSVFWKKKINIITREKVNEMTIGNIDVWI